MHLQKNVPKLCEVLLRNKLIFSSLAQMDKLNVGKKNNQIQMVFEGNDIEYICNLSKLIFI